MSFPYLNGRSSSDSDSAPLKTTRRSAPRSGRHRRPMSGRVATALAAASNGRWAGDPAGREETVAGEAPLFSRRLAELQGEAEQPFYDWLSCRRRRSEFHIFNIHLVSMPIRIRNHSDVYNCADPTVSGSATFLRIFRNFSVLSLYYNSPPPFLKTFMTMYSINSSPCLNPCLRRT